MYFILQPKQIFAGFLLCAFACIVPSALNVTLLLSHHMSRFQLRFKGYAVVIVITASIEC